MFCRTLYSVGELRKSSNRIECSRAGISASRLHLACKCLTYPYVVVCHIFGELRNLGYAVLYEPAEMDVVVKCLWSGAMD